jgi:hypothetical protein
VRKKTYRFAPPLVRKSAEIDWSWWMRWMALGEPLHREPDEDGVGAGRDDVLGAALDDELRRLAHGSRGRDHVVEHQHRAALDVADQVLDDDLRARLATLVDDREVALQDVREHVGDLHVADVGGDDDDVAERRAHLEEVVGEHRRRADMVDGDVEEALDLRGVEVHAEHAVRACGDDQVRDELRGDRHAALVLAVLARVAVVGDHRGDALRARAAKAVDEHQELHQVVVDGLAGREHDIDIAAAHILVDLDDRLAVGEARDGAEPERKLEVGADPGGEVAGARPAEDLEVFTVG